MGKIEKVRLSEVAARIERPFIPVELGYVGELMLSLFVCQGTIGWHRHVDEDELFLVYEGVVALESELGTVMLHPEELAVVPKGVGHRTGSTLRSLVLLIRLQLLSNRRNGHRRMFIASHEAQLEKVSLSQFSQNTQAATPYTPTPVATIEDFAVHLMRCQGIGPRETVQGHTLPLLVQRGAVGLELEGGGLALEDGDLVLIPQSHVYRLMAAQPALVLTLLRQR